MRPIKESTYNAIKSRNMTGANRFNHEIIIDGASTGGYSEILGSASGMVSASTFSDFCLRSDGKVLYAHQVGYDIFLNVLDSEEAMTATYNVGLGGTLFHTYETNSRNYEHGGFSLLRLKNGSILFFIFSARLTSGPTELAVYKSANGLGDDFTLLSTPISENYVGLGLGDGFGVGISKAIQLDDGSIILGGYVPYITSNYAAADPAMFKSKDGGLTWTWTRSYINDASFGSSMYWNSLFSIKNFVFGNPKDSGVYSTDYGETWTKIVKDIFINIFDGLTSTDQRHIYFTFDGIDLWMYAGNSGAGTSVGTMYKAKTIENMSYELLNTQSNWEVVWELISHFDHYRGFLSISPSGSVHYLRRLSSTKQMTDFVIKRTATESTIDKFKASSISISKSHGGASTATIQVDNKGGVVNPRNQDGPLYKILNLNSPIIIRQGYSDDLVDSFTGIIDSINMSTFPQVATIALRDNFKRALDQTITKNGKNVVGYANQPIENIVSDLCTLCGLEIGYIEPTGITIAKEFSWQSYADAFQFLSDIASFEYLVDESGKFHFRRDFQPGNMQVAWSFEEGVDITNMSYSLDDNDLYNSVRVYGMSGENIIVYNAPFLDAAQFNILPQKVLKIDATEASTVSELRKIAERAISTMRSRTRVIDFSAIAVPHLQTGDFIQIFESSTDTHEIYRLTSINLTMTDKNFLMSCKAYYYGDSIVPGELPTDSATQTPDPNLNLIPEMTSNTTPSGVARASSVYKNWAATYSPWRSLNGNDQDYFWDANTRVAWIEYEFPEKTIVDKYIIRARETILYNKAVPRDWTFEAFDGEKWIVLDTRTEQINWQIYEERSFLFANTTPYAKYRLNITRNNGYVRTQFERLKMYYGGGS